MFKRAKFPSLVRGWSLARAARWVPDAGLAPLTVSVLTDVLGVRLHDLGIRAGADQELCGGLAVPAGDVAVQPAAEQAAGGVLEQVDA